MIGTPFPCVEAAAAEVLGDLGRKAIVCANDPPWRTFAAEHRLAPLATVDAWNMELDHLERRAAALGPDVAEATVVGFGGGTALDTAKFVAWRLGLPLVQIPTITSVDAGFTDAIGVRDGGRVRYIGKIEPRQVVLDVPLVRSAPVQLNRAGIGDILSCHTGLFDWRLASDAGHGPPWDPGLTALGRTLLAELDQACDDVAAVSGDGVRFLADAYSRIGAACAAAGHSRFEEGSEHFWAYAYEHATGAHPVHGEIISLAVCALAHVQGNDPDWAHRVVSRSAARAHPDDLGVGEGEFTAALVGLAAYARAERLDITIADLAPITPGTAAAAWRFVNTLPRRTSS